MHFLPPSLERLIIELAKLPGIGRKSAQRLAFFILKSPDEDAKKLAQAILDLKQNSRYCSLCYNITEANPCSICGDPTRDHKLLCVVEEAHDIFAIEKLGHYHGLYHVLGGVLSPLDDIGPDDLHVKELLNRIEGVEEVIVATNPSIEGEATAIYLSNLLKPLGQKITRIARGIPAGSDLEFVDEVTLLRAFEGRRDL